MPNTNSIRAGRAHVEVWADKSKLERDLNAASARLRAFGKAVGEIGKKIAMIGTAGVTAGLAAVKTFANMGDSLQKMSKRTGFSVEALSELSYVAKIGGTSIEDMETGFRRMERSIYDAGRGLSTAKDALADLGLTYADLAGKSPDEQFAILAQRLSEVDDETKKAGIAMSLFGRNGTALFPMIEGGAASIEKLRAEARDLGLTMSTEDANAAAEFTDMLTKLWTSVKMGIFAIGSALAPMLQQAARDIMDNVAAVRQWIGDNKELIVTVFKVAAGLAALGIALVVIGKVIGVFAGLVKVVSYTIVAVKALGVAFTWLMAHPVVLTFTGIVAALVATVAVVKALTGHTSKLSDVMQNLRIEGDKQRATDELRMQRLEQLAAKEKLNNAEMDEARGLIDALNGRYGDLGAVLDETTGKINGVAEAHKNLAKAMKEAALAQIDAEIAEHYNNLKELQKEQESIWFDRDAIEKISNRMEVERQKIGALAKRRNAIEGGDKNAVTGDAESEDAKLAAKIAAEKRAAEEVRKVGESEAEWKRRLHIMELEEISDKYEREKALINERYDYEIQKAKEANATKQQLDDMEKARQLELREIDKQRYYDELQRQREADDHREQEAQRARDANLSRQQTIEELKLRQQYEGLELEKKLLELQERRELEEAEKAGERLDLIKQEYELRQKLLEASDQAGRKSQTTVAAGTFNAATIQSLQGYHSEEKRIANATEKIAENTGKLLQEAREAKLVFA